MKQTKNLLRKAHYKLMCCLGLLTCIFYSNITKGDLPCTNCYSCRLLATSPNNPLGPYVGTYLGTGYNANGPYIYDDGTGNFYTGGSSQNCGRQYLFYEYINQPIIFTFSYGGIYTDYSSYPTYSHDIYIYKYNYVTNMLDYVDKFLAHPDQNTTDLSPSTFTLDYPDNITPGEYHIMFYRAGLSISANHPDITGIIILTPPIEKIWIEAPPVCADFSGTQYNFTVQTIPDIATLVPFSDIFNVYTSGDPCDEYAPENIVHLGFGGSSLPVNQSWHFNDLFITGVTPSDGTAIPGDYWYIDPSPDFTDYTISTSYLADYLQSGSSFGATPYITVTYSDGFTSHTATAPILIESPSSLPQPPISTTDYPPTGPPNAIGIPWPSYDIYKYTVSGTEIWTPTNNPMADLYNNTPYSTIRIQNNIEIPPGAQLILQGMTLEMGPNATITVDNATTASGVGGIFQIQDLSTITAYRGCYGTDASNWQGITVLGNPAFAQGSGFFLTSSTPQGKLIMENSTISDANLAIQNGNSAATAGGVIVAWDGYQLFSNNMQDIKLWEYHNMVGGVEISSQYYFSGCDFNFNPSVFLSSGTDSRRIAGTKVKGVVINNCNFYDYINLHHGIEGLDAGFNISNCVFDNFNTAIYSSAVTGTISPTITGCTFNNSNIGVMSYGDYANTIVGNTFNIPKYTGTSHPYYPGTHVLVVSDQNIGALMSASTGFNIQNNTFQTDAPPATDMGFGYYQYTTGTLEYYTGYNNNRIISNTFNRLGTAMLSNFNNNGGGYVGHGLKYLCNTDSHIGYDIAVVGNLYPDGGINSYQSTINPSYPTVNLPAGNQFSVQWNLFNRENYIDYWYNSTVATQNPANRYGINTIYPISTSGFCPTSSSAGGSGGAGGGGGYNSDILITDNNGQVLDNTENFAIATQNVHYYMTLNDTSATPNVHRDSLYYWAGVISNAYGDLLITNLLIEDSLIDSAVSVYNNIINKYSLDSMEANDFVQGANIINIIIAHQQAGTSLMLLQDSEVTTLRSVVSNAKMWAHARAEAWLNMAVGDTLNDTLLYPAPPDATTPGVLAITEISNGTANNSDCQYAEIVVANCMQDTSNTVDVSNWIIDDNNGSFDVDGCDSVSGITPGHYRLANINLWKNMPVGSVLVLYNGANNCYNLPDTFTIDSTHRIYWIPIPAQQPADGYVIERYIGTENASMCSYCSDTGSNAYTSAFGWDQTVYLDSVEDAMQVRCPGCNHAPANTLLDTMQAASNLNGAAGGGTNPFGCVSCVSNFSSEPPFYQGIGYAGMASSGFFTINAGINDAGGPVDYTSNQIINKFVFNGASGADFAAPGNWQYYPQDTAGAAPATLGYLNDALTIAVNNHTLNMPCCNYSSPSGGRFGSKKKSIAASTGAFTISVYPTPVHTSVTIQFSTTTDATIQLTDLTGRLMQEKVVTNLSTTTLNIAGYVPGMYLYKIITKAKTQTGKIVVE